MLSSRLLSLSTAMALGLGATLWLSPAPAFAQSDEAAAEAGAETADAEVLPDEEGGVIEMAQGDVDAPVTIIEYASFTCPHCADFHDETYPELRSELIDTGLVRFVYREVYFDRYGLWAGIIARCAGPMRYFGLVDLIYDNQSDWISNDPAETAENLRRLGRQAGLSDDQMNACLGDAEGAEALYAAYQANMEEHPITGTPSLVIDGELYSGNRSYEELYALIEPLLPEEATDGDDES